ncbi:MAG: hypothetical protein C3F11_11445 [Methylocystaceae bacterium]|nr:MAG: hypothetical protein C3F11_11445 [Methylocystaceae bacterium]
MDATISLLPRSTKRPVLERWDAIALLDRGLVAGAVAQTVCTRLMALLLGSIVRPNKKQITQQIYETKLTRWRALWPKLVVVDWWAAEDSPQAGVER